MTEQTKPAETSEQSKAFDLLREEKPATQKIATTGAVLKPQGTVTAQPVRKAVAPNAKFGRYAPANIQRNFKMLLVGDSGSGKTTMAATFPDPLFIDLDNGMRSVANMNLLRYPANPEQVITDYSEVEEVRQEIIKMLKAGNAPFKTVVIDGLNDLREKIMKYTLGEFDADRLYEDQPTLNDYGKLKRETLTTFYNFLELPCNVVFICSAAIPKYEDDKIFPDLGSTTTEICRKVDAGGYCYTTMSSKPGEAPKVNHVVSFADNPKFWAKDRLGIGPQLRRNHFSTLWAKTQTE